MRLESAYTIGMVLATLFSLLGVLLGFELPPPFFAALLIPLSLPHIIHRGAMIGPRLGTSLAFLGLFLGLGVMVVRGVGALLLASAMALILVMCARMLTRETRDHDLQTLLLSFILILSGAGLHTQITYGPVFVVYALAVVWALVSRELWAGAERESERDGGAHLSVILSRRDVITPSFVAITLSVALAILFSTAVLFFAFPRVGFGSLSFLAQKQSTLPQGVDLQGPVRGAGDNTVVARVGGLSKSVVEGGLYLRGDVYERATLGGFLRSQGNVLLPSERVDAASAGAAVSYEVHMQPLGNKKLLTLGPVMAVNVLVGGRGNPNLRSFASEFGSSGTVSTTSAVTGAIRYEVVGEIRGAGVQRRSNVAKKRSLLSNKERERLLELPANFDPRIGALAKAWVGEFTSAKDVVLILKNRLRNEFEYSLDFPAGGDDPIAKFLFESRRGHCEYFAATMAMLLRSLNIPARVAGGFAFGVYDEEQSVVAFRSKDAHAWVEWYDPARGFVTVDPTPEGEGELEAFSGVFALWERMQRGWDDFIIDYGVFEQISVLRSVGSSLGDLSADLRGLKFKPIVLFLTTLLGLGAVAFFWRRSSHKKTQHPFSPALEKLLEQRLVGGLPEHWSFRRAFSKVAESLDTPERETLREIISVHEQEVYGVVVIDPQRRHRLVNELNALLAVSKAS